MEPKKLKISNDNNKLQCFSFLQIHFAPLPGSIKEADFDTMYLVPYQCNGKGEDLLVMLADFARIPFKNIGNLFTLPATGLQAEAWKKDWLKRWPKTREDTEMAVYCYVKVEKLGSDG